MKRILLIFLVIVNSMSSIALVGVRDFSQSYYPDLDDFKCMSSFGVEKVVIPLDYYFAKLPDVVKNSQTTMGGKPDLLF